MAKVSLKAGTTSYIAQVFIQDSSSSTGAGLTGLVFNSGSLAAYYHRDTDTTATAMTLVTMTVGTFTSLGFKEIDATNMPGWYQFCPPNAAIAAGAKSCAIHLKGATNMAPLPLEIELTAIDNQDAVRGGMTALPNANAAASGGLPILGANATAISFTAGMTISNAGGDALALTSSGSNGSALNASGNGTGAGIKATAGATGNGIQAIGGATSGSAIKATGTAGNAIALELAGQGSAAGLSATGGATGPGFKAIGGATSGDAILANTTSGHGMNLAPTGTNMHGLLATGGNGGTSDGIKAVAGTGGVPIRGDLTGNITGNLSGSTGSVTGAVGSVTGNVGGNVVGSVASVTGAVGSVTGAVGSVTGNVGGNVVGSVASVSGNVGGNVTGSVGSVASGGITRASLAADTGLQAVRSNTAQAGASTSITLDASASAVNDFYTNDLILLTGGTGAGQARYITAYNGTTKVATVTAWKTNPDNTSTFAIMGADAIVGATAPTAAQVATAVWQDLLAGSDFSTASSIGKLLKDDIDAAISSRMATYTQPSGFLAATFPGTVASPTNITAGTITTVTNLTNAPTAGDLTATMKTSVTTAATAATPTAAAVTAAVNTNANATETAIKAKTDQLAFTVANQVDSNVLTGGGSGLDAAATRTALGLASANLDTQLAAKATAASITALNNISPAQVRTEAKGALADYGAIL